MQFLERYLSPLALAWFYQDDDCLIVKEFKIKKIILSTECFTNAENIHLAKLLQEMFFLTFSIDNQNRLLLYDQKQILFFLHIVKSYIPPYMNRKLLRNSSLVLNSMDKRTTIKLSTNIKIKTPTMRLCKFLTIFLNF